MLQSAAVHQGESTNRAVLLTSVGLLLLPSQVLARLKISELASWFSAMLFNEFKITLLLGTTLFGVS